MYANANAALFDEKLKYYYFSLMVFSYMLTKFEVDQFNLLQEVCQGMTPKKGKKCIKI